MEIGIPFAAICDISFTLMRYTTTLAIMVLMLSACCYKKDCAFVSNPVIAIKFIGFSDDELKQRVIYIAGSNNYQLIDSITSNYNTEPVIVVGNYYRDTLDLRQQAFIIKTPATLDTINDINYKIVTRSVSCNQCFPVGHDKQTATTYDNFSFTFRSQVYHDVDTLTIIK